MKVDNIKHNYQAGNFQYKNNQISQPAVEHQSNNPAFEGAKLSAIQKKILEMMPKSEQRWFKVLNNIQDFSKGEMGGIVITAGGTGLVAPLPIAFNPFVKAKPGAAEEEKAEIRRTKQYTAWRQPISAVLAILFQASVQKPIDKFLQNLTNDKETAGFWKGRLLNQTSLNDEKYIELQIKKGKIPLRDLKVEDEAGNITERKETIEEAKERIIRKQKNDIIKSLKKDGTIRMGDFTIKDADVANIINNNIDDYIRAAEDLKIPRSKLKDHVYDGADFIENESTLRNILSSDKLDELPRVSEKTRDIDPKALKEYLIECRKQAPNEAVENILTKIINQCDSVRESNCSETLKRIDLIHEIMGGKDKPFDMNKYRLYLSEQNEILRNKIKELEALKFEDVKKVTSQQIKETLDNLVNACIFKGDTPEEHEKLKLIYKDNGAFLSNPAKLKNKVYNDVVSCYKEVVGHKFGLFKQMTKVLFGVSVTLPITCTVLNWVYPRFMELFFPNLAGIKKDTESAKGGEQ